MNATLDIPSIRDAQHYVGMAYEPDAFDCSDLVALVLRELFGKTLHLPPHGQRPSGRAGRRRVIGQMRDTLAMRLDAPAHGAIVLMQQPPDDGGGLVWHLGVAFADGYEWWLLHNASTLGGVWLHRMSEMGRLGLRVEGYYRCA